jgi:FkbM family methyltransferase
MAMQQIHRGDSTMSEISHRIRRFAKVVAGTDLFVLKEVDVEYTVLGSEYGRWPLVTSKTSENSVIYSFGVGEDISFDLRAIDLFRCPVFAFDPTPKAVRWIRQQHTPPQFHFLELGLGPTVGEMTFHSPKTESHVSYTASDRASATTKSVVAPVADLRTIMQRLNHRRIDVLKMDVEGVEYAVIDTLSEQGFLPQQLMIEFHHGMYGYRPFDTKKALATLRKLGYRRYYVSETGRELGFLAC